MQVSQISEVGKLDVRPNFDNSIIEQYLEGSLDENISSEDGDKSTPHHSFALRVRPKKDLERGQHSQVFQKDKIKQIEQMGSPYTPNYTPEKDYQYQEVTEGQTPSPGRKGKKKKKKKKSKRLRSPDRV